MKKLIPIALLAVVFAGTPLLADAQACTSAGAPCTFGGQSGVCAQNTETGDYYCRQVTSTGAVPTQAGSINTGYLQGYMMSIIGIINGLLVPLLIAVAFIVFLWGVYKYYIYHGDSDSERATGHKYILWSVIGFVVIFSVWGLVNLVGATLNLGQAGTNIPAYPRL